MLFRLARPLLFALDPETAHEVALPSFKLMHRCGLAGLPGRALDGPPVRAMGLEFPNPVGLAAGLDKNAAYIDALAAFGFGFLEVGTVTPRPQPGNPRPRLFRIPERDAIINRMGFNNVGVERLVANLRRTRYEGILGINIGKNADTPIERALDDYLACLERVYPHASYVTVNISSPNTKNLRRLQQAGELAALLGPIVKRRDQLAKGARRVPLAVKIAPDLDDEQIATIARLALDFAIDALIATNTTVARDEVAGLAHAEEAGGLSGAPVRAASTRVVRRLAGELRGRIPIIGVGGILDAADAREKLDAGASLLQVYTGLVYRGPALVSDIVGALSSGAPRPAARAA